MVKLPFNLPLNVPYFSREQQVAIISKALNEILENDDARKKLIELIVELALRDCVTLEHIKALGILLIEIYTKIKQLQNNPCGGESENENQR